MRLRRYYGRSEFESRALVGATFRLWRRRAGGAADGRVGGTDLSVQGTVALGRIVAGAVSMDSTCVASPRGVEDVQSMGRVATLVEGVAA